MGKENESNGKNYTGYDSSFSTYLWNRETKEFFGRTGVAWAKLTIFYIIFYIALAAFAGLCYHLFSYTLYENRPKWILKESLIGANPGLGYRPMPDPDANADSTLIWYHMDKKTEIDFWSKQLEKYVDATENSQANDCSNGKKATETESCRVDISDMKNCTKANKFGYNVGEPCILLKLNKILGWDPDVYGINKEGDVDMNLLNEELDEQQKNNKMPDELKAYILAGVKNASNKKEFLSTVWISCEGEQRPDQENLGNLQYYPAHGLQGKYFPYNNQPNYISPFIFVQLTNPQRGVLLNIECKAWARNIDHDRINRQGSVHFEVLIDGQKSKSLRNAREF